MNKSVSSPEKTLKLACFGGWHKETIEVEVNWRHNLIINEKIKGMLLVVRQNESLELFLSYKGHPHYLVRSTSSLVDSTCLTLSVLHVLIKATILFMISETEVCRPLNSKLLSVKFLPTGTSPCWLILLFHIFWLP